MKFTLSYPNYYCDTHWFKKKYIFTITPYKIQKIKNKQTPPPQGQFY